MKLNAVYNKKFGQWKLCHDQWCAYGETSVVAHILTSLDAERDGKLAKQIATQFNAYDEMKADIATLLQQLHTIEHAQDHEAIKAIEKKYGWTL